MRLALATATHLGQDDFDKAPLSDALAKAGIAFEWLGWDDPRADFSRAHMTLLRSTWNYVQQRDAFLTWAEGLGMRLVNPPVVVRWNTHKRYLKELETAGLPTVETVLVPKGSGVKLADLMKRKHWFRSVAKPAIGADSFSCRALGGGEEDSGWFSGMVAERDMLLQPYMGEVETSGERCVVTIEGEPTHAVRKQARFEGGREQVTPEPIADDERTLARAAVAWVERALPSGKLLYARVDMVRDNAGQPRIMELELVEPSLFFAYSTEALERFVEGIRWRMATLSVR